MLSWDAVGGLVGVDKVVVVVYGEVGVVPHFGVDEYGSAGAGDDVVDVGYGFFVPGAAVFVAFYDFCAVCGVGDVSVAVEDVSCFFFT